ncbi:MAG: Holliday junction resolvase RuvX [Alphaproteobacteria bacterium]|nr:Holliday junction resolvase RuvX [Alphaproteobacteria bacterium]
MSVVSINELREKLLNNQGRLIGLDLGTKTIGVALGDPHTRIVSPFLTINRTKLKHDLQALHKIIRDYKVKGVILGLPLNMDGTEGKRCQATRQFARDFLNFFDIPLCFWDERLTTQAALNDVDEMHLTSCHKNQAIDALAASYILKKCIAVLVDHS